MVSGRIIEFNPDADPEYMVEYCNGCGSTGVIHFDERDGDENAFHRCLRCQVDYIGCNLGPYNIEPRTRLSGVVAHRRSK